MAQKELFVKGAREHNLKNIDVKVPRDSLTVFTGLSGSGKSSLAFDTIYAEGQRRYVESLSSYARQFLGQMEKPDMDYIEGLSPAISIDQKTTSKNPRSTVGTVTEIYDYLRLLYARIGLPHCPVCGRPIEKQTVDQVTDRVLKLADKTKIQILSPIAKGKKGEYKKELAAIRKSGYVRIIIDGITYDLSEDIKLDKNKKHTLEVVVDRLVIKEGIRSRLAESIESAVKLSGSSVNIDVVGAEPMQFSLAYACPEHDISIEELTPRMFSFNNPFGACSNCAGLGTTMDIDENLIFSDENLSIRDGAIDASGWSMSGAVARMYLEGLADNYGFSLDTPVSKLPSQARNVILYGTKGKKIKFNRKTAYGEGTYVSEFEGIVNNLKRRYDETSSDIIHQDLEKFMRNNACKKCGGMRLRPESLAVTVGGINIYEFCEKTVVEEIEFLQALELTKKQEFIATPIIKEIVSRLKFLNSVGLDYLTLSRAAATLSGGESQRIRLATQIGSSLMGVLYILDEPSIGLHQKDNMKLLGTLKELRDMGNTLIVVEHDEDTILNADYVVDIGPGAGVNGGNLVYSGDVEGLKKCKESVTGQYLCGAKKIPVPANRRQGNGSYLKIVGAKQNNLKGVSVDIPLGTFTAVTGVSGSGKSSLVNDVLYRKLANTLNGAKKRLGKFDAILGMENLDKVINISQSPIGKTSRSNPATYTGVFDDIRELFAQTKEAKLRGYKANRFSFNVKGGRCEACQGEGVTKIEMHFLADMYVPCDICGGKRYNRETLEVKYNGKTIFDVLDMTVETATEFFSAVPKIYRKLKTICDVGLGYVKLGQPAPTLSGGEAQRVKLATELSKVSTGKTFYILDEPTTGLHTADVHRLIDVLQRLVENGNTVLVIEHNLDMIKSVDYVIDLGPDGGSHGGEVVATGTPEEVAKCKKSYTGQFLKKIL